MKGFEPSETGKQRDISVKERFSFLSEKASQPLEHRCNIPLINSLRRNGFNKVEKNWMSQNLTWQYLFDEWNYENTGWP